MRQGNFNLLNCFMNTYGSIFCRPYISPLPLVDCILSNKTSCIGLCMAKWLFPKKYSEHQRLSVFSWLAKLHTCYHIFLVGDLNTSNVWAGFWFFLYFICTYFPFPVLDLYLFNKPNSFSEFCEHLQ